MKILPKGKYDYDVYPLTERVIEIDENGDDIVTYEEIEIGLIEIDESILKEIRITKKFDNEGKVVNMTGDDIVKEVLYSEINDLTTKIEQLKNNIAKTEKLMNQSNGELEHFRHQLDYLNGSLEHFKCQLDNMDMMKLYHHFGGEKEGLDEGELSNQIIELIIRPIDESIIKPISLINDAIIKNKFNTPSKEGTP